ncbi:MAG: hypothetical protein ACLGIA_01635 [Actinomycetes bacterium]
MYAVIAGLWNLFAGISRVRASKSIAARHRHVPAAYEGIGQLVVLAVLNVLLGGVIGIVFIILDVYVRDQVLKNRHLFDKVPGGSANHDASAGMAGAATERVNTISTQP